MQTQNIFTTTVVKKHKSNNARVTRVTTPHGTVLTPAFMPVGTRAFVNQMTPEDLEQSGSQIVLGGNTYHMLCIPGLEVLESLGGMHSFMNWHKPMLTDSGGYQVFSLSQNSKICKIDHSGAHFKHPVTGQVLHLTPQTSIGAQKIIGADIIMAFDECTPEQGGREAALVALERTHRWLLESKEAHERERNSAYGARQALFGIVQGGSFRDLREQSAEFVAGLDLDGCAVGGEVIGYNMVQTCEILSWVMPILPENKVHYAMGVGLSPQDLIDVVAQGVDIFDCVAPTRNARHGSLYCGKLVDKGDWLEFVGEGEACSKGEAAAVCGEGEESGSERSGHILIKKGKYAKDERPIMEGCECYTCRNYSRGYLHYLMKEKSSFYAHLGCIHNVFVMQEVCRKMRDKIGGVL